MGRAVGMQVEAVEKVTAIKTERGWALADIVRLMCDYVFRLHMPRTARSELVSQMADMLQEAKHAQDEEDHSLIMGRSLGVALSLGSFCIAQAGVADVKTSTRIFRRGRAIGS